MKWGDAISGPPPSDPFWLSIERSPAAGINPNTLTWEQRAVSMGLSGGLARLLVLVGGSMSGSTHQDYPFRSPWPTLPRGSAPNEQWLTCRPKVVKIGGCKWSGHGSSPPFSAWSRQFHEPFSRVGLDRAIRGESRMPVHFNAHLGVRYAQLERNG